MKNINWDLIVGLLIFLVSMIITFAAVAFACAIAVRIFKAFS